MKEWEWQRRGESGIKCKEFSRNDIDFLEVTVFRKGRGVSGILTSSQILVRRRVRNREKGNEEEEKVTFSG